LKLLDVVATEGLRLHPAAPASLPRVSPKGGAKIAGIWVPEDVSTPKVRDSEREPFLRVSRPPFHMMNSTHHNKHIFPRPFTFDPTRWLTTNVRTLEMKEAYMPFSRGSRMCIDIHLATMELKMILATISYGWELSVRERTADDVTSITDHFVLTPKGRFCELYFKKINA
jgi:hypothetical protein